MKNFKIKSLVVLMLTIIMIMASTLTAFASKSGQNSEITEYIANAENIASSVKNKFKVSSISGDTQYDDTYRMYTRTQGGKSEYYYIKESDEAAAVDAIKQAKKSSEAADSLKDITSGLNIEADTGTATTILSGFTGIISTILGIMVVLISIGMTIFSAFDLCYIAFPVFRNKCEEAKQTGQGVMASSKVNKSTGETKLRFVSDDAQFAVVSADTVQSGKNPFVIYFGKRVLSYVILAILLFILLTGNITVFTSLALKVVSGILELIANF